MRVLFTLIVGYYAISKRSAEDYIEEFCKLNKLNFTILRFGSIYGKDVDKNNGIQEFQIT